MGVHSFKPQFLAFGTVVYWVGYVWADIAVHGFIAELKTW
jgi:hypothetical protein